MQTFLRYKYLIGFIGGLILLAGLSFKQSGEQVDFNTQVKPLINKKCIICHGGVKRKAGFSLLFRQDALSTTESGKPAIIPGDPDNSEFIKRLSYKDVEERMPYHATPLTKDEINLLSRWVKQGAKWGDHWAYRTLEPIPVPKPAGKFFGLISAPKNNFIKNDIDYFILDKLEKEKLTPSLETDKATLLRRVSLDLTGLPAQENLKNQFLSDNSPKAYENLVDNLLSSPQYGERWTAMWLDLARYADTKGYERDDSRNIWRYRDWLIESFNTDKPYNEFLTEQLAGDLMPNATTKQLLATAFHRNTMTNDEGGTENEEFRTAAVMDRVNTTWETLMGTTFACVQCHSHPYDPFRHEDYYKFLAFFNNTRDEDTQADYPLLREYQKQDSIKYLELHDWVKTNMANRLTSVSDFLTTLHPSINSLTADNFQNSELSDTKWLVLRKNGSARLKKINLTNKNQLIFPYSNRVVGGTLRISLDSVNGFVLKNMPVDTSSSKQLFADLDLPTVSGVHNVYLSYTNPKMQKMTDNGIQFDWFHFTQKWVTNAPDVAQATQKFWDLLKSKDVQTTPVMLENPSDMRRTTNVFERGNWLVKGQEVQPDVPKSLNAFPTDAPRNRLGMAMWLTDKKNPLTARAYVNRIWEQLFGQGLAETLEDLGTQGIAPTHRELLDYLAYEFVNADEWRTKKLLKKLVMSGTYRQSSKMTAELQNRDPFNKLYARAPRVRLSAEQIRDQALSVSGLLSLKMYGKSVFPYQPKGIWNSPWNGASWKEDTSGNQYRRGIYTYWKRTSPYPSMITFDGVNRELCMSRRIRTNTPLQALVTLNDSTYMVAALALAKKMSLNESDLDKQISKGYELALCQNISNEKRLVLKKLYDKALVSLQPSAISHQQSAISYQPSGKKDQLSILSKQKPELAALAVVANAILNTDEFVNKM